MKFKIQRRKLLEVWSILESLGSSALNIKAMYLIVKNKKLLSSEIESIRSASRPPDGYIEYEALKKAINQGGPKAIEIERKIRAYHPWPGTFTVLENQNKRMKIIKAHLENKKLVLEQIQLEGKKSAVWDKNSQKLIFG